MESQELPKCLYEILNVDRFCSTDDIKKSYKTLALKNHPDKAPQGLEEEYKEKFQTLNNAYQILVNPQERAWYDSHREEYLNPHKKDLGFGGFPFDVKEFMQTPIPPEQFFKATEDAFRKILVEEEKFRQNSAELMKSRGSMLDGPWFGDELSSDEQVVKFYDYWMNFVPCQNFAWADLWDEREGENRREKRFIQQTNLVERKKAKKKYMATLNRLISFIQQKDERYAVLMKKRKEDQEKRKKEEEENKIREEKEWQLKKEELLKQELKQYEEERKLREEQSQGSEEEYYEENEDIHKCHLCNKEFKSENQLNNHNLSKQHLKNKKKMMKEVALDEEKVQMQEVKDPKEEMAQEQTNKPNAPKKKKKKKKEINFTDVLEQKEKPESPKKTVQELPKEVAMEDEKKQMKKQK